MNKRIISTDQELEPNHARQMNKHIISTDRELEDLISLLQSFTISAWCLTATAHMEANSNHSEPHLAGHDEHVACIAHGAAKLGSQGTLGMWVICTNAHH